MRAKPRHGARQALPGSTGAALPAIEDEAQRLMDERRQGILRQVTDLWPQLDRLAHLLVHEEGVEVADLLKLLGS